MERIEVRHINLFVLYFEKESFIIQLLLRAPENLEEKLKPFDWTFSTDYRGTLSITAVVTSTEERIDIEKLKLKEKILFYQDLMLYEDELHDNGIASCTIKIVRYTKESVLAII